MLLTDSHIYQQPTSTLYYNLFLVPFVINYQNFDLIVQILKSKPILNLKDKIGWYPLHYAVQGHLLDVGDALIKAGADIEVKDNYGNTPLWQAVFSSKGRGEIIELLLIKGADPNNPNDSDVTPFKLANTINNYNIKQYFI